MAAEETAVGIETLEREIQISPPGLPTSVAGTQPSNPSDQPTFATKASALSAARNPGLLPPRGPERSAGEGADAGRVPQEPPPDLECFICFNLYSPSRLPKLLACRHVFCTVCLKLVVQKCGDTWRIVCPVCREVTAVPEGLIGRLPNKEDALLGSLRHLGPQDEASLSSPSSSPDAPPQKQATRGHFEPSDDSDSGSNRAAAKRLMFLLFLLVLLVTIVLPFLEPGLLKWTLCLTVGCGLVVVGILSFNPTWNCLGSDCSGPCCRRGPMGAPSAS